MLSDLRITTTSSFIAIAAVALGTTALAQTQQKFAPSVTPQNPGVTTPAPPSATVTGPQFRDPKTGQIWTPDNVGQDNKKGPLAPEDRAFDPSGQTVAGGAIIDQTPTVERLGTVPITAGPTVPLVVLENMEMVPVPGDHWVITVNLVNNSANTYTPVFICHFDNGSQLVARTRVLVPTTSGGERLKLTVNGPSTTLFVDKAGCDLTSP